MNGYISCYVVHVNCHLFLLHDIVINMHDYKFSCIFCTQSSVYRNKSWKILRTGDSHIIEARQIISVANPKILRRKQASESKQDLLQQMNFVLEV